MELIPIVELIRLEESVDHGTFGVLRIQKQVFCVTLEPADRENEVNRSSIPAQQYRCRRWKSTRFGDTYLVMDVPGRSGIVLHPGNTDTDTAGCIILAQHFGKLRGNRAVLNSGRTFQRFITRMRPHDFFHLTIREVY